MSDFVQKANVKRSVRPIIVENLTVDTYQVFSRPLPPYG